MSDSLQRRKAETFAALHRADGCFVMPNAWDTGSAKMLAACGFPAIGTTSAGIACSLGRPDHSFSAGAARIDRETMIASVRAIAASIDVPLSADLEAGYGETPEDVAETMRRAIDAGAVGGNIEDYTGDRAQPLFEVSLAVERIKAAREAINRSGLPFVLVGRTDGCLVDQPEAVAESIRRANLYRLAGADCLFVPGISDAETIRRLVGEIDGPLNVVMGLTKSSLTVADLTALGVRRISIGASLARAMYLRIQRAGQEMMTTGTFTFADEQLPQEEVNRILLSR